jgi:hypothetical protein
MPAPKPIWMAPMKTRVIVNSQYPLTNYDWAWVTNRGTRWRTDVSRPLHPTHYFANEREYMEWISAGGTRAGA